MGDVTDDIITGAKITAALSIFGPLGTVGGAVYMIVPILQNWSEKMAWADVERGIIQCGFRDDDNRLANAFKQREIARCIDSKWTANRKTTPLSYEIWYVKQAIPVRIAMNEYYRKYHKMLNSPPSVFNEDPVHWNLQFLKKYDSDNYYKEGWNLCENMDVYREAARKKQAEIWRQEKEEQDKIESDKKLWDVWGSKLPLTKIFIAISVALLCLIIKFG